MMLSPSRNASRLLTDTASRHPERTAIVFGDDRITYAALDVAANRVANLLISRGIQPGDKVALSCPNLPQFSSIYFGILKVGAAVVPLNVLLRAREVTYHLADSDAKAYFAFEGTPELPIGQAAWEGFGAAEGCTEFFLIESGGVAWAGGAVPAGGGAPESYRAAVAEQPVTFRTVERDDDDTAVILYTSGTTGHPKGAELRHRNVYDNALIGRDLFAADPGRPDTYLCVLPLFHAFGQTVIQNGAFAFGGTIVMQPRFEAQAALRLRTSSRPGRRNGSPGTSTRASSSSSTNCP